MSEISHLIDFLQELDCIIQSIIIGIRPGWLMLEAATQNSGLVESQEWWLGPRRAASCDQPIRVVVWIQKKCPSGIVGHNWLLMKT